MNQTQIIIGGLCGALLLAGCSDTSPVADGTGATEDATASTSNPAPTVEWREGTSADGTYYVRWRPLVEPIPMADPFDAEVEVYTDASMSQRAAFDTLILDAGMPHHGHGMNVVPEFEQRADGTWIARGMLMHMPGRWQIYVDVFDDDRLERTQWSMWLSG